MRTLMRITRRGIMTSLFDANAPKKATNLSINSDLLVKSRSMRINLSATLEQALSQELARREAQKWKDEHKAAIKAYNEFVEEHGCFGDEFRNF
jgi:antitoxin CcdA